MRDSEIKKEQLIQDYTLQNHAQLAKAVIKNLLKKRTLIVLMFASQLSVYLLTYFGPSAIGHFFILKTLLITDLIVFSFFPVLGAFIQLKVKRISKSKYQQIIDGTYDGKS